MVYIFEGIAKLNQMISEHHIAMSEAVDSTLADVNHVYVAHTPRILHEKHVEPANQAMSWISTVIGGFIPLSCKFWNEAAGSAIIMTVGLVNQGIAHLSAQEAQHQLGNYVGVDGPM